jgi:hypothetical protein
LLKTFTSAQIPLAKLEHPASKEFLEKYTKMSLKSESWHRKYLLSSVYTNELEKKYKEFSDKNIDSMFDETTDASGGASFEKGTFLPKKNVDPSRKKSKK